jgi:hypothetical protein
MNLWIIATLSLWGCACLGYMLAILMVIASQGSREEDQR